MGIVELRDVIAWEDEGRIYCDSCVDNWEAKPLTADDFANDVAVYCDGDGERIL